MEVHEELRGVIDILSRIKHGLHGGKVLPMKVLVDLHAADVDEFRATLPRGNESTDGLTLAIEEHRLAFHVHRERLKRSLASRFRQTDGIEDAFRYRILRRGGLYFPLTSTGGRFRIRYRRDQGEDRQQCRNRQ